MDKESAAKFSQVLRHAQGTLLKVASERDQLQARCDAYEQRDEAAKVASAMHSKGLHTDKSLSQLTAEMMKAANSDRLATIEAAVEMVAPDMGVKLASLGDEHRGGDGTSDLEQYIWGGVN